MSFLLGSQKQLSNVNQGTGQLDSQLINYLMGQLGSLNPSPGDNAAYLKPYTDLFATQNAKTAAQAKESAGNLTGSGLGNTIGTSLGQAEQGQNAFLANLLEQHNQAKANRFAQLFLGTLGSPAGGVTNYYQPGVLDYLMQGAATAANAGAFGGAGG